MRKDGRSYRRLLLGAVAGLLLSGCTALNARWDYGHGAAYPSTRSYYGHYSAGGHGYHGFYSHRFGYHHFGHYGRGYYAHY